MLFRSQVEAVGPGEIYRSPHPRLVGGRTGRVVAAQAHPEDAHPVRVDVVAPLQVVRHGRDHPLVGRLDRELVFGLALAEYEFLTRTTR